MRRWDVVAREFLPPLDNGARYAQSATSDNGAVLAGVTPDRELRVWDVVQDKLIGTHRITDENFFHLGVTSDGQVWWNRFRDGKHETVSWSSADGAQHFPEIYGGEPWRPLVFSPSDGQLVYQEFHKTYVWNLTAAPHTGLLLADDMWPKNCAAFSPDGTTLAIGQHVGEVRLHSTRTGELTMTLRGHDDPVDCLAFSADGRTLISGCRDGTVGIWDTATGQIRSMLKHHRAQGDYLGGVTSIAYSPTGDSITTSAADGAVKVWRTELRQDPGR